jgi:hypothetical protein
LHVVSSDAEDISAGLSIPSSKLINGRPLVFFRTYVGAATKACCLGLLDGDGLMRVVEEAQNELKTQGVPEESSKWMDLERDIDDAYRTLGEMY